MNVMVYIKPLALNIRSFYVNTSTILIMLMFMADKYKIQLKHRRK